MTRIIWFVSLLMTTPTMADTLSSAMDEFSATYKKELGSVKPCAERQAQRYSVCSDALRNEGNSRLFCTMINQLKMWRYCSMG